MNPAAFGGVHKYLQTLFAVRRQP